MAKATKVQSDDECDENNGENESDSVDDDEPTKDELFDMLEDAKTHFDIKRRQCKVLAKELKPLGKPLMSSVPLMRVQRKTMTSLARLTRSLKMLIPLFLSKMRRSML
jgi:hypothetical protein